MQLGPGADNKSMTIKQAPRSIAAWTQALTAHDIPVLRETAERIAAVASAPDDVSARTLASIILTDPLMTLRTFAAFASLRRGRAASAVTRVEGVIVMMGVPRFLDSCQNLATVEDLLAAEPDAIDGLMGAIDRSHTASRIAWDFAVWRNDLDGEELAIAALLHDIAEVMVWTFAPRLALATRAAQQNDPHHRSASAQQQVLHVELPDLQLALAKHWGLPDILVTAMHDHNAVDRRVRNVYIAVNIARHSVNLSVRHTISPALAHDYAQASQLLNITPARARAMAETHTLANATSNEAPVGSRG